MIDHALRFFLRTGQGSHRYYGDLRGYADLGFEQLCQFCGRSVEADSSLRFAGDEHDVFVLLIVMGDVNVVFAGHAVYL